jgi:hypothetical protein
MFLYLFYGLKVDTILTFELLLSSGQCDEKIFYGNISYIPMKTVISFTVVSGLKHDRYNHAKHTVPFLLSIYLFTIVCTDIQSASKLKLKSSGKHFLISPKFETDQ